MKIRHLKRQVGPHAPGTIREVGYNTAMTLIKQELAEEIIEEPRPRRGPGRPRKVEKAEPQKEATDGEG